LYDSLRKALSRVQRLIFEQEVSKKGWRKIKSLKKQAKSLVRSTSWAVFKGKKESHKKEMVEKYLTLAKDIESRIEENISYCQDIELTKYKNYISLFINQIDRRLLKGETIPAEEKVFSIFEEHTEWISKGKRNAELGNLVMITTNQHQLILDYKIMYKEKDAPQIAPLLERLKTNYPNQTIDSLSTDKGFYSKNNLEDCIQAGIRKVVMPKKGKCNKTEYAKEHEPEFIKLRNKHSAVESNINSLEHHGLNRCMDKGKLHFERYVAVSILAYNLHLIGKEIIKREKEEQEKVRHKLFKQAA
jgi:transposase, IS5 family